MLEPSTAPRQKLSLGWACLKYMQHLGWDLEHHQSTSNPNEYWIQWGIEDFSRSGHPVPNDFWADEFNDRYCSGIWIPSANSFVLVQNCAATTEPGIYYTQNRMNADGAARLATKQQFKAWQIGQHGTRRPYEALVQRRELTYYRDDNENGIRDDRLYTSDGNGINLHHGGDSPTIDRYGAGCQVKRFVEDHQKMMRDCQRYRPKDGYYAYGILPGDELFKFWLTLGGPADVYNA